MFGVATAGDTVCGVHGTLCGAFTDTSNMHGQVPMYSPVMFDEKMYVGKDLSSGGSIGNIGSRRRAGSIGAADCTGRGPMKRVP